MCVLGRKEILELLPKIFPYDRDVKVSENGVDLRIGDKVGILPSFFDVKREPTPITVKEIPNEGFVLERGQGYLLHTKEYVRLPEDVIGLVGIRSTVARLGILNPVTIVDAGFEGQIVLEFFPTTNVKIYPGTPMVHLILIRTCSKTKYEGRYQGQRGIVGPKLPLV